LEIERNKKMMNVNKVFGMKRKRMRPIGNSLNEIKKVEALGTEEATYKNNKMKYIMLAKKKSQYALGSNRVTPPALVAKKQADILARESITTPTQYTPTKMRVTPPRSSSPKYKNLKGTSK